jgi:hypothetical protein
MKILAAVLFVGLIIGSAYCESSLREAKKLLENLEDEIQEYINDLTESWHKGSPLLLSIRDGLKESEEAQGDVCRSIESSINGLEVEADKTIHLIEWANDRMDRNAITVANLTEKRCEQSVLYVDSIMNDKMALKLIGALREVLNLNADDQIKVTLSSDLIQEYTQKLSLLL